MQPEVEEVVVAIDIKATIIEVVVVVVTTIKAGIVVDVEVKSEVI